MRSYTVKENRVGSSVRRLAITHSDPVHEKDSSLSSEEIF